MAGIGKKMEENVQLQEFVERMLSCAFTMMIEDEDSREDFCSDMGITENEMYWLFEQLGYDKEDYTEEED